MGDKAYSKFDAGLTEAEKNFFNSKPGSHTEEGKTEAQIKEFQSQRAKDMDSSKPPEPKERPMSIDELDRSLKGSTPDGVSGDIKRAA